MTDRNDISTCLSLACGFAPLLNMVTQAAMETSCQIRANIMKWKKGDLAIGRIIPIPLMVLPQFLEASKPVHSPIK